MKRFATIFGVALLAVTWVSVIGCNRSVRWPELWHPGPAGYQRYNALFHDPYPVDDMGPEIVGGRPRSYQRPIPEAERAQPLAPPPVRPGYPWH